MSKISFIILIFVSVKIIRLGEQLIIKPFFDNLIFWSSSFSEVGPYFCRLTIKWTLSRPKIHFDRELKTDICKSLTRKPSYSSFFSAWCTDFKNVIFGKIHWAPSEVVEVKRSFLRSPRPNFGFHLVLTSFHLEFSSFWISRLFDLGDLSVLENGTRKHFENGLKSMQIFQRLMGGMNRR